MTTTVILQSNYIPWRGYFDLMRRADNFVIYDEVQYTKNDWRNRNQIIGLNGPLWLTIPVKKSGKFGQTIAQTETVDGSWAAKHWATVTQGYRKAPQFKTVGPWLQACYESAGKETHLSRINEIFVRAIADYLGIKARIVQSADITGQADRVGRLVQICEHFDSTCYLSGPAAKSYLDEDPFDAAGIRVDWMEYPIYPATGNGSHDGPASVLDALFWLPRQNVFDA